MASKVLCRSHSGPSSLIQRPSSCCCLSRSDPAAWSPDRLARIARMAALALSLLNVLFAALLVPILVVDSQGGDVVTLYGMPPWLTSALAIPLVTTALTVAVVIFAIMAWRRGFWSLAGRIQYSILAASAAAFAWSLAYINMLGFHY